MATVASVDCGVVLVSTNVIEPVANTCPLFTVPVIVTALPYAIEPGVYPIVVVVLACDTVSGAFVVLVEEVKLLSPPYTAEMLWEPAPSVVSVN